MKLGQLPGPAAVSTHLDCGMSLYVESSSYSMLEQCYFLKNIAFILINNICWDLS